jgi:hypothetical protein
MRAAVMEGIRKPLVVRDVPDPTPAPNGAVIRVEANGISSHRWHPDRRLELLASSCRCRTCWVTSSAGWWKRSART